MAKKSTVDLQMLEADGGLKELVLRWFRDTQAQLILQNGNFPNWFQGLAARKEAEDVLRDKALGCFLIRLSDKAIGYILSYKGHDRCRHFVISQNPDGQFVISGDCQLFGSLTELIEHYKVSPIQPFGEYLTSSCCQDDDEDLYDVVNAKKSLGVSVQALRTLWDQVEPEKKHRFQQHRNEPSAALLPSLPPKSRNRKLTGTVSVDATSLSQALPPVPKRGMPLGFSLSGSLPDTTVHPVEVQNTPNRVQRISGKAKPTSNRDALLPTDSKDSDNFHKADVSCAELNQVESRSQSLPYLGNYEDEGEEEEEEEEEVDKHSTHFKSLSITTSLPPKKVTCQTYSLHSPSQATSHQSSRSDSENGSQDQLRSNPLYQSSDPIVGAAGQQGDNMYAEVSQGPKMMTDDTYEQIPGDTTSHSNTYESVEDMKNKKPKSSWGKNNIKWKKFRPDYKKK
ncbi:PREDICTED: SH2 domain-containing protein 7-like [Cyprinodon variegatus]|uniref:SH2 domain-containing protein 7-like n=1 Tax=Cyprinodon variegatus TaxID=28743 RepID=UPI00074279A2|nr:PREDICTED: SH2 domain-containing protein 7-like [Cyprinodon variegatus]